ncbi:MAG: hypothetical protein EXQ70_10185 [Solirubrobacterales bacterium]|nr:hypothetical protein [Solirubrobacterales bacterium]
MTERVPFQQRQVTLQDQFGQRNAQVAERKELCNPVQKRAEPFHNRASHLQCYGTSSPDLNRLVAVQNQFGSQRLLVHRSERLCLPSRKSRPGKPAPKINAQERIDHFQCYGVGQVTGLRAPTAIGSVKLFDQFGKTKVKVGPALRLCAPVSKNGGGVLHRVSHLVCYRIKGRRAVQYGIRNQFEGVAPLRTIRRHSLCVPSNKVLLP